MDRLLVVTGEPRSGTSLMMQTLKHLGLDIAGSDAPWKRHADEMRTERAEYLNPKGFYEIPGVVARGLRDNSVARKLYGKAVKIITPGLLRTKLRHMDKIIFCLRDPREIALSQSKLVSNVTVFTEDGEKYAPELQHIEPKRYIQSMGRFVFWQKFFPEFWDKALIVDYREMLESPDETIFKVLDFIDFPSSIDRFLKAVSEVDPSLYRSVDFEWETEDGRLAQNLYEGMKKGNLSDVEEDVKGYLINLRLESVRWLDDDEFKTWVISNPSLHRSLVTNNNNVRDNLQRSAATTRVLNIPVSCEFYERGGEEYTIIRPKDIGPLTRDKIKCGEKEEEVPREVCFNCWMNKLYGKKEE